MKTGEGTGEEQAKPTRKLLTNGVDPSIGADTQFKAGESGNPKGRPKGKSLSKTIQELLDDENFIERLDQKIKERFGEGVDGPDPEFQGTPMRAMITTAVIEAIDPTLQPKARASAREWLGKYGFGTKVDVTSKGERISDAPKIISIINARPDDASVEAEAS